MYVYFVCFVCFYLLFVAIVLFVAKRIGFAKVLQVEKMQGADLIVFGASPTDITFWQGTGLVIFISFWPFYFILFRFEDLLTDLR